MDIVMPTMHGVIQDHVELIGNQNQQMSAILEAHTTGLQSKGTKRNQWNETSKKLDEKKKKEE